MRRLFALTAATCLLAGPALSQTPEWRTVDPENLLVIEATTGRILIELSPDAAPQHVERVRTLVRQGFYDGIQFHRVMPGFMAQTGDPTGTGTGGSELPDLAAEFSFRRDADPAFAPITGSDRNMSRPASAQVGLFGSLPVVTQPDGQMFATRDGKVDANAVFCTGVVGAARTGADINSANSQFFIMNDAGMSLNGQYTVWGRVVGPMDAVMALAAGTQANNGAVEPDQRDGMTRVRLAADIAAGERPSVQVLDTRSERFRQLVEEQRAAEGGSFSVCDITLPVQVTN